MPALSSVTSLSPYFYWRLEDSGATAADASGNGRTGTYTSGTQQVTAWDDLGWQSSSSGTNYVRSGFLLNSSTISTGLLFKVTALPSTGNAGDLMGFMDGDGSLTFDKLIQVYDDGKIGSYHFDGAVQNYKSSSAVVAINNWYLVVRTIGAAGTKVWLAQLGVDSAVTLVASGASTTSYAAYTLNNVFLNGLPSTSANVRISAVMDEFFVLTTQISESQINAILAELTSISLPFISASTSLFALTLSPSVVNLSLGFISAATSVFAPSIVGSVIAPFISAATSVFAPTFTASGSAPVALAFISAITVLHAPTIAPPAFDWEGFSIGFGHSFTDAFVNWTRIDQ